MQRYFGSYRVNPDHTMDIRRMKEPIPQEVLEHYREVTKPLIDIQPMVSLYEVAHRNGEELVLAFDRINADLDSKHSAEIWNPDHALRTVNNVNRLAMNFIWSSRAFIEQTGPELARTFGERSNEFQAFLHITRALYDTHFSYRFFVVLRNYVTHRNLPVSDAGLTAERPDSTPTSPLRFKWSFTIDRDAIIKHLKDRKEKAPVRRELAGHPKSIDLIPILHEQVQWNNEVFREVMEVKRLELMACHDFLRQIKRHASIQDNEHPVIWVGPHGSSANHEHIPVAHLERAIRLVMVRGPSVAIS